MFVIIGPFVGSERMRPHATAAGGCLVCLFVVLSVEPQSLVRSTSAITDPASIGFFAAATATVWCCLSIRRLLDG